MAKAAKQTPAEEPKKKGDVPTKTVEGVKVFVDKNGDMLKPDAILYPHTKETGWRSLKEAEYIYGKEISKKAKK